MRLRKILIETLDVSSQPATFVSTSADIENGKLGIFLFQRIDSGSESVSAKNLVISDVIGDAGPVRATVLVSGDRSIDHLSEAATKANALLIAEGK